MPRAPFRKGKVIPARVAPTPAPAAATGRGQGKGKRQKSGPRDRPSVDSATSCAALSSGTCNTQNTVRINSDALTNTGPAPILPPLYPPTVTHVDTSGNTDMHPNTPSFEVEDTINVIPLTSVGQALGCQVPPKIKENIWNGEYIDLGHMLDQDRMLTDNHPLTLSGVGEGGQLIFKNKAPPKIDSIERWTTAFISFASVYLERHHLVARQLFKYMDTVRSAASRFGTPAAFNYDKQFRYRLSLDSTRSWDSIDSELWLFYMTKVSFNPPNHAPTSNNGNMPFNNAASCTEDRAICFGYNKDNCTFGNRCGFRHACSRCGQNHQATNCMANVTPSNNVGPASESPNINFNI
jgi:hypothetical protein